MNNNNKKELSGFVRVVCVAFYRSRVKERRVEKFFTTLAGNF
jgi:hypothetical protein